MLQTFHPNPGLGQVPTPGERAMIRQQNRDMSGQKRFSRVSQARGPRGGIRDTWHLAHQHRDFGKHVMGESLPRDGEGRSCGRVGMYDRAALLSLSVGPQV